MSAIRTVAMGFLALVMFVALGGCIAVAAGAGVGTAYALGEETMYSDFDVDKTETAVKLALEDFEAAYSGTEKKPDGVMVHGSKFIEDDTEKIQVGIWDKGEGKQTKIEVRIGTIGKKEASLQLMELIQKRLDAMN